MVSSLCTRGFAGNRGANCSENRSWRRLKSLAFMIDHPIRFVVFRYDHHSPHSGYSKLAEFGLAQFGGEVIPVSKPLPRAIVRERLLWHLAKGTPGYDRTSMAAELNVAYRILREKGCLYHFLYGEKTYHYAGFLNNIRENKIVATFHLPPEGIRNAVQIDWHIRQLSAVICLGRNQQEYFEKIIEPDRIFFVPLGLDTEYFTPPPSSNSRNPNLCLFVGENYRDFPTFRGVLELVSYRFPGIQFVAVLPSRSFDLIGKHPNLLLRSGVPESELLELYRTASVMVMPLKEAVANNAVLESMACGLPLVVTDVGAIRDYVTSDCAVLIEPYDSRNMAEAVINLLNDPDERQRLSKKSREQALKFSWPEVVRQLESVYNTIA
jgi:glycosyltransferase involved in cell wall biosynthesis